MHANSLVNRSDNIVNMVLSKQKFRISFDFINFAMTDKKYVSLKSTFEFVTNKQEIELMKYFHKMGESAHFLL